MKEKRENRKRHSEKERKKEKQNYILTDFSEWCVSIQIDEFNQCKGEIIADWYQQVELDSACFRFLGRKWLKSDNEFGYIGNPITYLLLSYWVVIWWLGSSPPKKTWPPLIHVNISSVFLVLSLMQQTYGSTMLKNKNSFSHVLLFLLACYIWEKWKELKPSFLLQLNFCWCINSFGKDHLSASSFWQWHISIKIPVVYKRL